jgi:hypothetical protein
LSQRPALSDRRLDADMRPFVPYGEEGGMRALARTVFLSLGLLVLLTGCGNKVKVAAGLVSEWPGRSAPRSGKSISIRRPSRGSPTRFGSSPS